MQEAIMQVAVLYLVFLLIVSIAYRFIKKISKSKIVMVVYILILLSPGLLYIPVELDTFKYGKEFKDVEIKTGFSETVIYYRVLSINDNEAKLFYVEGENGKHDVGNIYIFKKENGKWKFHSWERTVWTNLGGSASEFTIPPYF